MPEKSKGDFSASELASFKRNAENLRKTDPAARTFESESHAYNWRSRQNLRQNRGR